ECLSYRLCCPRYGQSRDFITELAPCRDCGHNGACAAAAALRLLPMCSPPCAGAPDPGALKGRERVLGPEHPDTLTGVRNLAWLYQSQGFYTEAEPLLKRALAGFERKLGMEHRQTLRSANNLAALYLIWAATMKPSRSMCAPCKASSACSA